MPSNPVADKLRSDTGDKIKTLSTGIRVIIEGISSFEVQELASSVPPPRPPIWRDPETGRDIENYDDPNYLADKQAADMKRGLMMLDSQLIGVKLVDGLPEDSAWLDILKFKAKRGIIDLEAYNLDNPIELEFVFKKYIAFKDTGDWELLQGKIQETGEAAKAADAVFPGDEVGATDSPASS